MGLKLSGPVCQPQSLHTSSPTYRLINVKYDVVLQQVVIRLFEGGGRACVSLFVSCVFILHVIAFCSPCRHRLIQVRFQVHPRPEVLARVGSSRPCVPIVIMTVLIKLFPVGPASHNFPQSYLVAVSFVPE